MLACNHCARLAQWLHVIGVLMAKVLLAGESWVSDIVDHKGFDQFGHTQIEVGCGELLDALEAYGHEVTHLRSHDCAEKFPQTLEDLAQYDVVVLSDVGSNTLLLHPDTFFRGKKTPNRLNLLKEWVENHGGGLMMAGGYLSFQGFEGKAKYAGTAIEQVLPVEIQPYDDRIETPEGICGRVAESAHPIVKGLDQDWPALLGYQKIVAKPDANVLARIEDDVLLAVRNVGKGKTLAFASDISPHWAPEEFTSWSGYKTLFGQCIDWLAETEN